MSDELDIRHGAVVAVDSGSLREVAHTIERMRERFDDAATAARGALWALGDVDAVLRYGWSGMAADLLADVDRADAEARGIAVHLRQAAAVYEYAELSARRDATTDAAERAAFDARLEELGGGIALAAGPGLLGHDLRAPWQLIGQAGWLGWMLGPTGPLLTAGTVWGLGVGVRLFGQGTVPGSARLTGTADPVAVSPIAQRSGTPVSSLAQATARIPSHGAIRVERYAMPGGERQFVVYIAGTGSGSAFDGKSNTQLYTGRRSASYEAVREALAQAGATPGDVVHEVGHSQGAMIAGRVALEGEYDVKTIVSLGSPIQADVPASTLSIDLRHTDDPVAALADGGSAVGVGAPDSIVVERVADPQISLADLGMPGHDRDAYAHTAALLDASADPRVGAVREVFADLGRAESVEVTEFTAERPASASSADAG